MSESGHPVPALGTVRGCDVQGDKPMLLGVVDHLSAWRNKMEEKTREKADREEERERRRRREER